MRTCTPEFAIAVDTPAVIGESPIWSTRRKRLLWIDIMGGQLHSFDPATGRDDVRQVPAAVGMLAEDPEGRIVVGLECELAWLHPDGRLERFARAPHGGSDFRFNDGKFDRQGRLWTGLMNKSRVKGVGILYRFDPDGTWHVADTRFDLPNGMEWSLDGRTFYFTDSHKGHIYAYDFDPVSGELQNKRLFFGINPADAKPDGLTMDQTGHLLSALFDGAAIARIAPEGSIERMISLPVKRPTSCAFSDDGRTIFVTTARIGLSDKALAASPASGSLLSIEYSEAIGIGTKIG